MEKEFLSFPDLINEAVTYLNKIGYRHRSLDRFYQEWVNIGEYMKTHNIERYTPEIGSRYLYDCTGHLNYKQLNQNQKDQIRLVSVLSDFVTTGEIRRFKKRSKSQSLHGKIGRSMMEWILNYKKTHNLEPSSIQSYYRYISVFMVFLNNNDIYEIKDIKSSILMEFINNIADYSYNVRREVVTKTNKYLKYLYEEKITTTDLSVIIRIPKFIHRPKLPVHYSKEEVEQIVNTINRATPEGKRDYAIILLAARLGLRCSDILNLSFSNLHWDKSLITICQFKTKQMVDLPLLPDIGNAIIDYLKFGRPISDSKRVFLRHTYPFEGMAKNHLYRISKYHIINSGIQHDNRKHGLHTLRHSLATNLLKEEVSMPIISGILGHSSSNSTKDYLRVDINSLRKCALDLPRAGKEATL